MTNKTPKVNYNLQITKTGTGAVILTMSVNRSRVRFSPKITIDPEYWDKEKQRISNLANLGVQKRNLINKQLKKWADMAIDIYEGNPDISAKDLLNQLKEVRADGGHAGVLPAVRNTLNGFALDYAREKKDAADGSKNFNHLKTAAQQLQAYADKNGNIYWADVDNQFASDFKHFLEGRNLRLNQIENTFRRVRQFLKASGSEEGEKQYHSNTAYKLTAFKPKTETPYKHYLNETELAQFLSFDFGEAKYLERVRDMFVLNAYTGLRRGDAKRVSRKHLHLTNNGNEQLRIRVGKAREYIHVPLLPIAKNILEKYNWALPLISDVNYNKFLKVATKRAGLNTPCTYTYTLGGKLTTEHFDKCEKISSHDARRSFATNFFELGFPAALLMKITGHKEEGTFMKYICTTAEKAAELFQERFEDLQELRTEKARKQAIEAQATTPDTITNN
jgi:integrase